MRKPVSKCTRVREVKSSVDSIYHRNRDATATLDDLDRPRVGYVVTDINRHTIPEGRLVQKRLDGRAFIVTSATNLDNERTADQLQFRREDRLELGEIVACGRPS